jgi:hypothetical protein
VLGWQRAEPLYLVVVLAGGVEPDRIEPALHQLIGVEDRLRPRSIGIARATSAAIAIRRVLIGRLNRGSDYTGGRTAGSICA